MAIDAEDFELETFRQVNEHMRATDRKYWITSGAYISLFILFMSRLTESDIISATPDSKEMFQSLKSLASHFFIGTFGLLVYLMQDWYRAWKEHYLEVLHVLRVKLYPDQNNNKYLPFWLRQKTNEQPVSVDNSLKLLTFILNTCFMILVCIELTNIFPNKIGYGLAGLGAILYFIILYIIEKTINKNNHLNA